MAILVSTRGSQTAHPHATHYIADPQGLLHIYTGETHTATYKEWDYAYTGNWDDTKPATEPKAATQSNSAHTAVPRHGFGSG